MQIWVVENIAGVFNGCSVKKGVCREGALPGDRIVAKMITSAGHLTQSMGKMGIGIFPEESPALQKAIALNKAELERMRVKAVQLEERVQLQEERLAAVTLEYLATHKAPEISPEEAMTSENRAQYRRRASSMDNYTTRGDNPDPGWTDTPRPRDSSLPEGGVSVGRMSSTEANIVRAIKQTSQDGWMPEYDTVHEFTEWAWPIHYATQYHACLKKCRIVDALPANEHFSHSGCYTLLPTYLLESLQRKSTSTPERDFLLDMYTAHTKFEPEEIRLPRP